MSIPFPPPHEKRKKKILLKFSYIDIFFPYNKFLGYMCIPKRQRETYTQRKIILLAFFVGSEAYLLQVKELWAKR